MDNSKKEKKSLLTFAKVAIAPSFTIESRFVGLEARVASDIAYRRFFSLM
tara:strand:- start:47 stop:196 length:150 start_codon:yes stop_codon:yes gene_type:complete